MNVIVDNPYALIGIKDLKKELKYDFIYQKDMNRQDSFSAISKKIHPKWVPDFIFRSFPEYCPFQEDRVFDCPVIGLISDWTIMYQSVMRMAKYFDYIFVDIKGTSMIKKLGLKNVGHTQMYSFDPILFRRLPLVKKIYDVSIVANLTHQWHPQRAYWIKRLALLSDRYKIRIFTKKTKEEYVKILNQSKITFNFCLRGEMNQRAYETTACGSLLFLEEENSEVRSFYKNKRHCVLYNKGNFERLLRHYLTHDKERNRIIEEAYKKVQQYSYFHQFQKIKKNLKKISSESIGEERTRINRINRLQRYSDRAICNFLYACWLRFDYHRFKVQSRFLDKIERDFKELSCLQPKNAEVCNNFGVFHGMLPVFSTNSRNYLQQKEALSRARDLFLKAIDCYPQYVIGFYNLAEIYMLIGEKELARQEFFKAVAILESGDRNSISISGLCLPLNFDSFHMQWQWTLLEYGKKNDQVKSHLRDLLLHRTYERLGDISNTRKSLIYYKKSISYWPNSGEVEYKLGRAFQKTENLEKAVRSYKKSMDISPFYFPAWRSYAKGLYALNRRNECKLVCKEFITILNAFPSYRNKKRAFINLFKQLK